MSKWINKEKFEQFKNERETDTTEEKGFGFARKYPNPKMGTLTKPNEYHVRLISDTNGDFYKKYYYHMFQAGESWKYIMCPKTHGMDEYCPWCALTQVLYQGSDSDKKRAYSYKRKEKFVGNVFVVRDPRDANENDAEKHLAGHTFLYEFPQTIETLIKKEITDTENGWGYDIFDPEKGYNFIISIGAKKPDKAGKVWPDYGLTSFAKRPTSIADTEAEIEEIMGTTQPILDYINKSMFSAEQHEELLKSEMVYEDVEDGFIRHMKVKNAAPNDDKAGKVEGKKTDKSANPSDDKAGKVEGKKAESKTAEVPDTSSSGSSDEDLLKELENM